MRPLLLGMCNPLSDDPEYDLYPYPEGSAGWWLWKMLPGDPPRGRYLEMFDRRNLLRARAWDQAAAVVAAKKLLPELGGRLVVVLGTQVRSALGLPPAQPLVRGQTATFEWIAMPHPSGRNRWYNDPANKARTGVLLTTLAEKYR